MESQAGGYHIVDFHSLDVFKINLSSKTWWKRGLTLLNPAAVVLVGLRLLQVSGRTLAVSMLEKGATPYCTLCESVTCWRRYSFMISQQNSMWTRMSTINCGSVSLVSFRFAKAVQSLEKGTT